MVTPELIKYIRGELAKGIAPEDIHKTLDAEGGWEEADISEALRIAFPEQNFTKDSLAQRPKSHMKRGTDLVFIIAGLVCILAWWLYQPQINRVWSSLVGDVGLPSMPSFGLEKFFIPDGAQQANNVHTPDLSQNTKDCGVGRAPDLGADLGLYEDDAVLGCLGERALACSGTVATLEDDLFPNKMEIVRSSGGCDFRLSYSEDSTLVDSSGAKLAGQYVSCPLGVVRAPDLENSEGVGSRKVNPAKYASQIYAYGSLGLFIENELDKERILGLGCSGPYIDSVISGYQTATES